MKRTRVIGVSLASFFLACGTDSEEPTRAPVSADGPLPNAASGGAQASSGAAATTPGDGSIARGGAVGVVATMGGSAGAALPVAAGPAGGTVSVGQEQSTGGSAPGAAATGGAGVHVTASGGAAEPAMSGGAPPAPTAAPPTHMMPSVPKGGVVATGQVIRHDQAVKPEAVPPFIKPDVPSFPGAEGAGMWTIGGRGGKVFEVTSLEDSGPGTLREAVEAEGPRMVVFRTGGVIHLKDRLVATHPYLTIAGQTAPGGGIVVADRSFWINTYNVIVRHVRVRMGRGRTEQPGVITDDAFGGRPVSDIMLDHVSASWGHDENLSFYKMEDANNDGKAPATERVTVQWSIIGETTGERFHPYGTVFGGKHATYHHNLHACQVSWEPYKQIEHATRPLALNPAPDDLNLINNVFFVWLNRGLEGGGAGAINIINNWFVPDLDPFVAERPFPMMKTIGGETGAGSRYLAGNVMQGREAETADNWKGVEGSVGKARAAEASKMFAPVAMTSAEEAFAAVLSRSGATLPMRDSVDERMVDATRNQKSYYLPIGVKQIDFYPFSEPGIIDLPVYEAGIAPADDDHDGLPNDWEMAIGIDPKNPDDGALVIDGYTNLEWYLNALADGDASAMAAAYK